MKNLTIIILLSMVGVSTYGQDFNRHRDSLMSLQSKSSDLYLKHKDGDSLLADRYLAESNDYFQQVVKFTVEYITANRDKSEAIIEQNLYMFDRDAAMLSQVMEIIKSQPNFKKELKERVEKLYNKAAEKVLVGKTAADFTLTNEAGEKVSLSDYKGKYVWLNFWASWCAPCRAKSRYIVQNYDTIKNDDLVILSVSFDENRKLWLDASEKDGMCWVSLRNPSGFAGDVKDNYKIESLPTTFLIGKDMQIIIQNPTIDQVKNIVGKKL